LIITRKKYRCPTEDYGFTYDPENKPDVSKGVLCIGVKNLDPDDLWIYSTIISIKERSINPPDDDDIIHLLYGEVAALVSSSVVFGLIVGTFIGCILQRKKNRMAYRNNNNPIY